MTADPVDRAKAGAELARANALLGEGRFAEALAGYDRFLALDPGFAPGHNNRALALLRLGRPGEAVSSLEAALVTAHEFDHGQEVVTEGDGLRGLRVGVSRHQGRAVLTGQA